MEIPKRFKIANQEHRIIVTEFVFDDDGDSIYGEYDSTRCEIHIAQNIRYRNETIPLTEEQIWNTFWHELFHAFNFFWNNETDESLAQNFANFMREFESTKQ